MNTLSQSVRDAAASDLAFPLYRIILRGLRTNYLLLLELALVGALISALTAAITSPHYTATIRLVPSTSGLEVAPDSGLAGFASTLSGLGVSLPRGSNQSDFILFPEMITSSEIAAVVMTRKDFLIKMFPGEYDAKTNTFHAKPGLVTWIKGGLWGLVGQPGYLPPDVYRVKVYITTRVKITEATVSSPVTTLSFTHKDRQFALGFLRFLYKTADQRAREWRVTRAQANTDYLESKLDSVSAIDYREGLITQLLPQQMIVMMSNPKSPFSARAIDGPFSPDRPSWPNPMRWIIYGAMVGTAIGMVIVTRVVFLHGDTMRINVKAAALARGAAFFYYLRGRSRGMTL